MVQHSGINGARMFQAFNAVEEDVAGWMRNGAAMLGMSTCGC